MEEIDSWCSIGYYEMANSCRSVARTSNSSPFTTLRNQELSSPRVRLLHHTEFLRMQSQSDDRIINFAGAAVITASIVAIRVNMDHLFHQISRSRIVKVLFDFPSSPILRSPVS